MKKKYKILLVLIVVLLAVTMGFVVYKQFFNKPIQSEEKPPIQVTNKIEEYGYSLEDRDTVVFKEKFENLKTLLKEETYDKEEYVSLISEMFIIDLFTINNKLSKYDIGGLEYTYTDSVPSLKSVIQRTIYNNIENNIDGSRTQSLPEVSSVEVSSISPYTYSMPDDSKVEGYKVVLTWVYVTDLGYDTEGTLLLIPDSNKYGVVYFQP